MQLADDTRNVLDHLEAFSEQGLRKRNDLGVLFELAARRSAAGLMNDLLFHGTQLYNLFHTLRKAEAGSDGFATLESEFVAATESVRDLIAKTMVGAEEEQIVRFEQTYYEMTQGSLRNLIDLSHDLRVAKQVQNDSKRGAYDESGESS
jgi:hypothetical protein